MAGDPQSISCRQHFKELKLLSSIVAAIENGAMEQQPNNVINPPRKYLAFINWSISRQLRVESKLAPHSKEDSEWQGTQLANAKLQENCLDGSIEENIIVLQPESTRRKRFRRKRIREQDKKSTVYANNAPTPRTRYECRYFYCLRGRRVEEKSFNEMEWRKGEANFDD
ncbi:hypothetical protein Trydic_g21590 [Trypoxylus dichotomus]